MNQPIDPKQVIHTHSEFKGLPVMADKEALESEYFDYTCSTIERALQQYPRVFAVRFALRYPSDTVLPAKLLTSHVMTRFVDLLKTEIKHNREDALKHNKRVHHSAVRYVWSRDHGEKESKPHYNFLLLLNRDAFQSLGYFNLAHDNLYSRIVFAWASALDWPVEECMSLVYFPKNGVYHVGRNATGFDVCDLMREVSYFSKVATKRYGNGGYSFGCSRD